MTIAEIENNIINSTKCPRLVAYCAEVGQKKKREFQDWTYWAKPVPGFGDENARVWIIGLAPAAHGSNRTGRMFTGDSSGNWLYEALYEFGFANQRTATHRDDGLQLHDVYVSSVVRWAPPHNKPTNDEIAACAPYLQMEWDALKQVRVIVALGGIAFASAKRLLEQNDSKLAKGSKFAHLKRFDTRRRILVTSYHPSRQNTQTGKLTRKMWHDVFAKVRKIVDRLEDHPMGKRNRIATAGADRADL